MTKITTVFNIYATTAIVLLWGTFDSLFGEYHKVTHGIDYMVDNLFIKLLLMVCLFIICILATTKVFQEIWNRLLSDVFEKRAITFNESYALSFLVACIFLG